LHLAVDDGIADLMTELAGGERKRGLWLSQLVRVMAEQQTNGQGSDFESLTLAFAGLAGEVHTMKGQVAALWANQHPPMRQNSDPK